MADKSIKVIVAADFTEKIMTNLRQISPQLDIEQHYPNVPNRAWKNAEILHTFDVIPTPEQAPNLRWIQLLSAGVDHVKDKPIVQQGVTVTSASGIHATPIAEYCIGMMLAHVFQLPLMLKDQGEKRWRENQHDVYRPHHLRGQTLGIVGYGNIGRELARLADALGMNVLASKRDAKHPAIEGVYQAAGTGDPEGDIPERIYPSEAITTMARECDYLVLLTPLTEATHHLIGKSVLDAMKKNAVLINVARGSVVDEPALVKALQAGDIAGAVLDVFEEEPLPTDSPLWEMDNVIISPHCAGNSQRYNEKAAAVFAENLQRYLEREDLLNELDTERGY